MNTTYTPKHVYKLLNNKIIYMKNKEIIFGFIITLLVFIIIPSILTYLIDKIIF